MQLRLPMAMLLSLALVGVACRKRPAEPVQTAAAPDAQVADAAPGVTLTVEVGQPIELHDWPDRIETMADGGFISLDGNGGNEVTIRRLAASGAVDWAFTLRSLPEKYVIPVYLGDAATTRDSVWVAVGWKGELVFEGGSLKRPPFGDSELLLLELDLRTGKHRAHHRLPGQFYGAELATDGDELYLATYYVDPHDGSPGWGPAGDQPRDGFRVARLDLAGNLVWSVDSTPVPVSQGPDLLVASECCVLVMAESPREFTIGDTRVTKPDLAYPMPWLALISDDGRLMNARGLYEPDIGTHGAAVLDGDAVHYGLSGSVDIFRQGRLGMTHDAILRRFPLECGGFACQLNSLTLVDAGILVIVRGLPEIGRRLPERNTARLYRTDGDIIAETTFSLPIVWHLYASRSVPGGAVLYVRRDRETTMVPVTVLAVATSPQE